MSCPGNGGRDDNALLFSKPEKDKALSLYSQQYALVKCLLCAKY